MKRSTGLFTDADGRSLAIPFLLVTTLFLLWGFLNGMIDVMDKHFQDALHLSMSRSAWVQFAHYIGYFTMALPAGWVAEKLGYKGGILCGLLLVALGGFWFLAATRIETFWAFLVGVGVIAAGLTFLETVANPYAAVLGPERFGATRINLAQSANGVGWVLGPIAGGIFFYSLDTKGHSTGSASLQVPYVAVAVVVVLLALLFWRAPLPDIRSGPREAPDVVPSTPFPADAAGRSLLRQGHFTGAVAAQFLYVAAQAGIFSFFINYMGSQTPAIPTAVRDGMDHLAAHAGPLYYWLSGWFQASAAGDLALSNKGAANLASVAFLCFLAGRVTGALLLRKLAAHRLLAVHALAALSLSAVIVLKLGWVSVAAVFACYFAMSIMFPTIFALGIHGLGAKTKRASSFLVMAIVGGAIVPKLMGAVADASDIASAFVVPMICFGGVALYALCWGKLAAGRSAIGPQEPGRARGEVA